jgi:hypothetical protein
MTVESKPGPIALVLREEEEDVVSKSRMQKEYLKPSNDNVP